MNLRMLKLFERLMWLRENYEPFHSDLRCVYQSSLDAPASVLIPDPWWMAGNMLGGIFPPVWVWHELRKDESAPDFKRHTRGHLLHETPPEAALTEEQSFEKLIMKDTPEFVWRTQGNRPRMIICRASQLPDTRHFRNAWRLAA